MPKRYGLLFIVFLMLLTCGGCVAARQGGEPSSGNTPGGMEAAEAYSSGDVGKSLSLYTKLSEADPTNHVYLNNMGVLLLKAGRPDNALKAFESASMRAPDNADYLINIGFAHSKLKNYKEALIFFNRATQLAPRKAKGYYGRGVASLELGESEIALGAFRQAAALDPGDAENLFMKAYAEQKNGLWADAIAAYTTYLTFDTDDRQRANAHSNRALCSFRLNNYRQGMIDLNKAVELDEASAGHYYNRAYGYQMQQQFEKAIDDYTRALSRKVDFPEAYINRGEMYFLLGNMVKGCSDLRRACDMGFCETLKRYEASGKCE